MKYIHFPTLAFHGLNMILAFALIHEYSDVFLFCAIAVLIVHVIWCCISPKPLTHTHLLGCLLQALFFAVFDVNSGAFGLGGGELALLFYMIALAGSVIAEIAIGLYKHFK